MTVPFKNTTFWSTTWARHCVLIVKALLLEVVLCFVSCAGTKKKQIPPLIAPKFHILCFRRGESISTLWVPALLWAKLRGKNESTVSWRLLLDSDDFFKQIEVSGGLIEVKNVHVAFPMSLSVISSALCTQHRYCTILLSMVSLCSVNRHTVGQLGHSLFPCCPRCKGQIGLANNKHGCFPSLSSLTACFLCNSLMYSWIPSLQLCNRRNTDETESRVINMRSGICLYNAWDPTFWPYSYGLTFWVKLTQARECVFNVPVVSLMLIVQRGYLYH